MCVCVCVCVCVYIFYFFSSFYIVCKSDNAKNDRNYFMLYLIIS